MARMTAMLADMASDAFLSSARVTDVSWVSDHFVVIELQADKFRSIAWTPGSKLQVRPRRGTLAMRTYTPVEWDQARGATRLVAFAHGEGPAAAWLGAVSTGDTCETFGPRGSIDLRDVPDRIVFVGDESSVGLACALRTVTPDVRHIFEASDTAELTAVLTGLGFVDTVSVLPKSADREPLIRQARDAAEASVGIYDLVVSGDAATVHALRRAARAWPRGPERTRARAYWAQGRTGLD